MNNSYYFKIQDKRKGRLTPFLLFLILISVGCSDHTTDDNLTEPNQVENVFYKGTTMGFVGHQETYGNVVFKENDIPNDPFKSIYDHGGNIVRFRIDLPPYGNNFTVGAPDVDFRSAEKVKSGMQRAKNAGLGTLLTFSYVSSALDPNERFNNYVAPLAWQAIADNIEQLKDSVYNHTYDILKDYVDAKLIPEIVSVGNEISWRFLEINEPEDILPTYNPARVIALLNSGTKAIRDINSQYNLDIKVALHIGDVNTLKWWMEKHMPFNPDFDIMGLSHYHAWTAEINDFSNWKDMSAWLNNTYDKKFMILETSQLFTTGGNDIHVDILGIDNIPNGYPNPPTTETQKKYLKDFAQEVLDADGVGLIVWGGEWVGSNTLIYADQWGAGSSWENKSFWDFNHNLHDGVNWMHELVSE